MQYFCEATGVFPGNYVSLKCVLPEISVKIHSGTLTPPEKHHITLVYSDSTCVSHKTIKNVLTQVDPKMELIGTSFDAFPDSKNPGKSALVLKIESPLLQNIHSCLVSIGCKHSFPTFEPHVTLAYGVDNDEVEKLVSSSNQVTIFIKGTGFTVEKIKQNWVDSI